MTGAEQLIESAARPAPVTDSDWLPRLATDINREHELAVESARDAVSRACRAGKLLIQAKHKVGRHGKWEQWVADNLKLSDRTARAYMKVARDLPTLPALQAEHINGLSLRELIAYLSVPKRKPESRINTGSQPKTATPVAVLKPSPSTSPATPAASEPTLEEPEPEPNPVTGLIETPLRRMTQKVLDKNPEQVLGALIDIFGEIFDAGVVDGDDFGLWDAWNRLPETDKPEALREIDQRITKLAKLHRRLSGEK